MKRLQAAVLAICTSMPVFAQNSTVQDTAPKKLDDETIVLSPFVVSAESETGYVATSTLAGTRLDTPLKDVGAAISVMTKDLMEDLGATDVERLLTFATGVEVGGVSGNYSAVDRGADFSGSDGLRDSPQNTARVRGLSTASITRGYYLTDIPFESYNTSRVTVNRGPNAVLFGLGSPSGVIDHSLNQAMFKDQTKLSFRYGSEGSTRSTLDYNKVLIPGKLAVRLNALYKDHNYQQEPAFERSKRIYGAISYRPFRQTSIRATAETGKVNANRPNPLLAIDNLGEWFNAGKPIYDWATYDRSTALNANNLIPAVAINPSPLDTFLLFYGSPNGGQPTGSGRSQIGSAQIGGTNPILNIDGQAETYRFYFTRNYFNLNTGVNYQGFTPDNASVFDWKNKLLEGSTSFQNDWFDSANVAWEQRALNDHIGLELSVDWQEYKRRRYNPFGNRIGSSVYVDINTTLSDGQPNPNFGRPFLFTGAVNQSRINSERETFRATGFALFDFAKDTNWTIGKWLGRHRLTGLAEQNTQERLNAIDKLILTGDAGARLFGAAVRPQQRQPNRVVYIGPSILNAASTTDVRLEPLSVPIWTPGQVVPVSYFDPVTRTIQTENHTIESTLNGGSVTKEVISSYAAILQSYWLKEHVITLIGWRQDESKLYLNNNPPTIPGDSGGRFTYDGFSPPSAPTSISDGRLWTYSVVANVPEKFVGSLPGQPKVSVFYNQSENFSAASGRIDFLGTALPAPEGSTKEYGLNLSFGEQKFALRYNYFETTAANAAYTSLVSTATQLLLFNVAMTWERDRNNGVDRSAELATLFRNVPESMKSLYNYSVTTDANGQVVAESRNPAGLTDTADSIAKGHELELTFNPTRNWRFLVNVARQETQLSNIAPVTRRWIEIMGPNWEALKNSPLGSAANVDINNPSSYPTLGRQVENTLYVPLRSLMAQEGAQALEQREWRVNVVGNYTFREGLLKGFGIGTGVRWQSEAVIGYIVRSNPDGSTYSDLDNPVTAPDQLNVDGWLSYERKLGKKASWRVQLNVNNISADFSYQPTVIQPSTGAIAQWRIPNSRTWYITNTFTF